MNKAELISAIAQESDMTKVKAEKALNAILQSLQNAMQTGDEVMLVGFGKFATQTKPPRKVRSIKTGEIVDIPERVIPTFKPSKNLKMAVKEHGDQ